MDSPRPAGDAWVYFTVIAGEGCGTGALLLSGGRGGVFLHEHENAARSGDDISK
jgi:hypothetical protein